MIMTTVLAVALGLAPVKDASAQTVSGDYAKAVGRYSQAVDKQGTTHLRGIYKGEPYEIAVDSKGKVEGIVGSYFVTFRVTQAS